MENACTSHSNTLIELGPHIGHQKLPSC